MRPGEKGEGGSGGAWGKEGGVVFRSRPRENCGDLLTPLPLLKRTEGIRV